MPTSSTSSAARLPLLIPFGYFAATRLKSLTDLGYLLASSFLPAWWLLLRLGHMTIVQAGLDFLAGYVCFIAIYEIGYLANDAWDAHRGQRSRQRLPFAPGPLFCASFVLVRLAAWAAVGIAMGWIANPVWLALYLALALVFCQHNLIASGALRSASFFQLAILRFVAPIVAPLDRGALAVAVIAAIVFYGYFRFLSYLESKDLLAMPERRNRRFALVQSLMLLPLIALLAFALRAPVLLELAAYFCLLYGVWSVAGRRDPASG